MALAKLPDRQQKAAPTPSTAESSAPTPVSPPTPPAPTTSDVEAVLLIFFEKYSGVCAGCLFVHLY